MAQCSPTEMLREEHRLILQVVEALAGFVEDGEPDDDAVDKVADCVTFFRLFTDACHHGKEEDLLFGSLVEHGLPREEGPVAVMLLEHEMGRDLVRSMDDGLQRYRGGEAGAWDDVRRPARDYVALLRQHITKEDHVLFNMADGIVPEPECQRLCQAYDAVCARRFEDRSLFDLERLADRITGRA